jgi:hypothetical protein
MKEPGAAMTETTRLRIRNLSAIKGDRGRPEGERSKGRTREARP